MRNSSTLLVPAWEGRRVSVAENVSYRFKRSALPGALLLLGDLPSAAVSDDVIARGETPSGSICRVPLRSTPCYKSC